ncbi:glycosyltransferase [Dongia sp.]|uniref:glycosyltransferase n=1 Tax=Dongia sp. TaxID=1977262 RepID=UPI0037504808
MSVLWVCKHIPYPMQAGDRVYSAELAQAVARAGVALDVVGMADGPVPAAHAADPRAPRWHPVAAPERGTLSALMSPLPLAAARFSPPALRAKLQALTRETKPEAVVLDYYGSGWALDSLRALGSKLPIVYVAHNFEEQVARDIAAGFKGSPARKLAVKLNAAKIGRLERRMVEACDLLVALTEKDRADILSWCPQKPGLVLPPGFGGYRAAARTIDAGVPRRVVMLGSVRWIAKQINVAEFLAVADGIFRENGIQFDIIGDVDEKFRAEWTPRLKATRFLGFVDDLAAELRNARLGLIIEAVGGGFKLKVLDYLFGRMPIAALEGSFEGLPPAALANIVTEKSARDLVGAVLRLIDDFPALNRMQAACYDAVQNVYDWDGNGRKFADALERLARGEPLGAPPLPAG